MPVDIFRQAFHGEIGSQFNRSLVIGRSKGVVNRQQSTVFVGNVCNGTNVRDRQRGIARCFDVHQLGVGTNCLFYSFQIRGVHNGRVHVELVFQQFVQQAVYGNIGHTGKYHMIAAFQQGEEHPPAKPAFPVNTAG